MKCSYKLHASRCYKLPGKVISVLHFTSMESYKVDKIVFVTLLNKRKIYREVIYGYAISGNKT